MNVDNAKQKIQTINLLVVEFVGCIGMVSSLSSMWMKKVVVSLCWYWRSSMWFISHDIENWAYYLAKSCGLSLLILKIEHIIFLNQVIDICLFAFLSVKIICYAMKWKFLNLCCMHEIKLVYDDLNTWISSSVPYSKCTKHSHIFWIKNMYISSDLISWCINRECA